MKKLFFSLLVFVLAIAGFNSVEVADGDFISGYIPEAMVVRSEHSTSRRRIKVLDSFEAVSGWIDGDWINLGSGEYI